MPSGKTKVVECIVLLVLTINSDKFITTCEKTENLWRKAGRSTGLLLHSCIQLSSDGPQEQFLLILQRCLKRRSLIILDRSLGGDVIKLANGIELVRYRNDTDLNRREAKLLGKKMDESDWKNQILTRIAQLFHTHVLKIHLRDNADLQKFEGRGRRKKKGEMMMMLLMFGIAAVVLIMVPMGFQFLAVLGGKALLLAKMALILTAIQGLKKIATSNLHYGLYTAPPEHHHHGHFDRQWPHYDPESHDTRPYPYQISDQQADLAHPLQPRIDFKDLM